MGQILHKRAMTTEETRRDIQNSKASLISYLVSMELTQRQYLNERSDILLMMLRWVQRR